MLYQFCDRALLAGGELAECGVFAGGTAHLLALLLEERAFTGEFHLFDTFAGMPPGTTPERDFYEPGALAASLTDVSRRLREFPFIRFHQGIIPDTLAQVAGVDRYCFVHVNVDVYPATLDSCAWFWPRMTPGGILLIGDYGFYRYRKAARAAVDTYFADRPEKPLVLPTGQAIVIKPMGQ
jgi:hypothetical protein